MYGEKIALLTTQEMAKADALTIASGVSGVALMEAAGRAVFLRADAFLGKTGGRHALVLCGPGNNGGDGFIAARLLIEAGFSVRLALLGAHGALKGDAALAAQNYAGPIEPLSAISDAACLANIDLVIDALFGAGLARPIAGDAAQAVASVNRWRAATGKPVLAVDVPSGVNGSTGATQGDAIHADETITFFRLKPGHLLTPGRMLCGAVVCADIGVASSVLTTIAPQTFQNIPALWRSHLPIPRIDSNKFSRGHVVVASGGLASTGAARLAARGALRAGAGLVTLASPADALIVNASALTAIMVSRVDGPAELAEMLADPRKNAVVIGPGLGLGLGVGVGVGLEFGESARVLAEAALAPRGHDCAFVLDADALSAFSADPARLFRAIAAAPGPVVLTPHGGEFARLFGASDQDKLFRARDAAKISGATIVFKGPDSVVAHPCGDASIAANAPPWLATAGSGDVLAGMIGGLLAQGAPAFEAASMGVWMHGEAARYFGPGLISEDITETLPQVWRGLLGEPRSGLTSFSPA